MRGIHIFEKPCCTEIRAIRECAMRGLPLLAKKIKRGSYAGI